MAFSVHSVANVKIITRWIYIHIQNYYVIILIYYSSVECKFYECQANSQTPLDSQNRVGRGEKNSTGKYCYHTRIHCIHAENIVSSKFWSLLAKCFYHSIPAHSGKQEAISDC